MPEIKLQNVTKTYPVGRRKLFGRRKTAVGVERINLTIQQGEFVFIVGRSGCGKTTLLNLITGETKADAGMVCVDQYDLANLGHRTRKTVRLMFGRVWQEQQTLARKMTVKDNLKLTARIGRKRGESEADLDARVAKVLGLVGMSGVEKNYPVELSIGQCRRVELARALINSPDILVLDEITANLDDDNIWDIFHLLTEINRRGTTIIMATHADQYVNIMQKRVITLMNGRIFGDVPKGKYGDVV